ncbi:muscle-specific protein 300 kDa isoform X4 [Euwallacea similis]|uniref:muscle-specific protein 300 kDa isoform X4 n=1 Tax=Euwallacea similis TaxID=1736056 RepID=UPI00344CEDBF
MNELLANITQRRNQLTTELSGPSGADETLSKSLDKLEKNLMSVIADKQAKQEIIDQYKQQLQAINTWFDNLNKRIDAVDKGSGLNCQQKQAALAEIQEEFDELGLPRMEELKRLASRVTDIVHNLDSQQVEEQVKSADRRYNDISKKLQRKAQVLEMTRKGIDGAKTEIDEARNWVKDKFNDLQKTKPISMESYKVEEGLNSLKDLLKDAENKVILKDSLLKRVNDMSNELEPSEYSELESSLKNLGGEQADLVNKIKQEIARLNSAAETRCNFEADLLKAKTWLKNKNSEVRKLSGYLPLQANQVEKEIVQHRAYDGQIKQFSEADLKNLLNAGNSILKDCDEGDKERLQHLLDEVQEEYNGLTQESKLKLEALTDLLQGRKQFEGDIDKVVNWLKEAEVATSTDIRLSSLEVLDEQLAKYEKLIKNSQQVGKDIEKISEQGKAILPTISDSDKITLKETLNNLKERHNRIDAVIKERTEDLRRNIQQIKEAQARLAESLAFVKEVQNQLHELNKPLGSRVEDVQNVLSAYERILKDIKADKSKLSTVPGANATELQVILNMQEDLIKSIEDQISKLKQLLLLREQYLALITEIMTFITKYTEIVRDVEKTGGSIEEKIKKYDDIIIKIQECEALHASATDKGLQIAQDCNVQDRNEITEQLQTLKQSLNNLRKAVEKQRQEHENTAAEYKKLASELEEILDWLHTNEGSVKSRPLLSRDIASVNKEINKHEQLNKDVNDHLDKLKKIQDSVKNDDTLPGSLQEQLSEANSLINSLPRELQEQAKYLEDNKKFREEYDQLKEKLYAWIKEADSRLNLHKDGVDFENIFTDLEEHKIFFGAESGVKEIAFHGLQQAADKIWPSLTPYEQEELSREQQHHTQTFKNTVNSAKSQKAQLEQDALMWKGYLKALEKVKALIARSKFSDEPVVTLAGLQFNIQKITHAINDIQNQASELDLLHTRISELSKEADEHNRAQIQKQSVEVTKEWSTLVSNLEGRKDSLTKLADVWGSFEGKLQNFERSLSGIEDRTKHIDQVVRNKDHVVSTQTQIEELYTEAFSLKSQEKDVLDHSKAVLLFLEECSPESASALSKKLDQLISSYERLLDNLKEKQVKVGEDLATIEKALRDVTQKKSELVDLKSEIIDFYVFDEDLSRTEKDLRKLSSQVQSRINDARQLSADLRSKYQAAQNLVPSDIAQELNQLELLTEGVVTAMEDKEREFKKARTIRTDYLTDVEELQNWIKDSELKIQDRSVTPQQLHERLQQIYSEIGSITDKLDKVVKNGKTIIEKSRKQDEKDIVQSTIDNLTDQISQVKSSLEEKRDQVGDILDAWQRFLALYQQVIQWTEERRIFLQEPLNVSSLQDVKQRLHDYNNAVKSCKGATKNLSDMVKELEYISTVTTVGDLPKKMEHAEEVKTEVEAQILERNALLQETSEEWEQCEKKMKEARTWAEKARTALESPQNKKKPLRDQHAIREKMLADIHVQKTKISLSIEKLQLHFRSGIKADTKITESVSELLRDLDGLEDSIKGQVTQLEKAILQVEGYQGELQQLRQQIVQVEQQLRTSMAPNYKPHDRDGATREQESLAGHVQDLQSSLSETETSIQYLPQEGFNQMLQALENITSELKKHATEAIRLEGQVMVLTSDHETRELAAHLAGIRTRIATLLSQAENGRIVVSNAQAERARKQDEFEKYQLLLREIESWIQSTKETIKSFEKPKTEEEILGYIARYQDLKVEIAEKEAALKDHTKSLGKFKQYPDLQPLVTTLLTQLETLTLLFEEQKVVIQHRIEYLQTELTLIEEDKAKALATPDLSLEATLDSTSMPIEETKPSAKNIVQEFITAEKGTQPVADIETQTGRSLSSPDKVEEEPTTKDFTVTYNQPVDAQIQTQLSEPTSLEVAAPRKETITITKRTSGDQDIIQIDTKAMAEPEPIIEEPDDLLVEANYRRRPESETQIAELNITNVQPNQPFETVFVEPDETTTEVIVDADGSKRILVTRRTKTVTRQQQSMRQQQLTTLRTVTEGDGPPVTQSFSQVTLEGQQSNTSVARGDGRRETMTTQQYGGKVVTGAPGGELDVKEFQSEPEVHYSVIEDSKPIPINIQGLNLQQGDLTLLDKEQNKLMPIDQAQLSLDGAQIHTSSSSVVGKVERVTRKITRITRKIVRKVVIIDGKEHVTEEVFEEPEVVEVTEEGVPRVSINVTRTENGQVVQEQQLGQPQVANLSKTEEAFSENMPGKVHAETLIKETAQAPPVPEKRKKSKKSKDKTQKSPIDEHESEKLKAAEVEPDTRYVIEQSVAPEHESLTITDPQVVTSTISQFIEQESKVCDSASSESSKVAETRPPEKAPERKKRTKKSKAPSTEPPISSTTDEIVSVLGKAEPLPLIESPAAVTSEVDSASSLLQKGSESSQSIEIKFEQVIPTAPPFEQVVETYIQQENKAAMLQEFIRGEQLYAEENIVVSPPEGTVTVDLSVSQKMAAGASVSFSEPEITKVSEDIFVPSVNINMTTPQPSDSLECPVSAKEADITKVSEISFEVSPTESVVIISQASESQKTVEATKSIQPDNPKVSEVNIESPSQNITLQTSEPQEVAILSVSPAEAEITQISEINVKTSSPEVSTLLSLESQEVTVTSTSPTESQVNKVSEVTSAVRQSESEVTSSQSSESYKIEPHISTVPDVATITTERAVLPATSTQLEVTKISTVQQPSENITISLSLQDSHPVPQETPKVSDFLEAERQNSTPSPIKKEQEHPVIPLAGLTTEGQIVQIDLSLEDKLNSAIATPKASVSMTIDEVPGRNADVISKDVNVQLPAAEYKPEKLVSEAVDVPVVSKEQSEHDEETTPSDIDHGGRKKKKKKKPKKSDDSPEDVSNEASANTSLAESTEIIIPEDSIPSEETPKPTLEELEISEDTQRPILEELEISEVTPKPILTELDIGDLSRIEESESASEFEELGYEADRTLDESLSEMGRDKKHRKKKKRGQKVRVEDTEESQVPKSTTPIADSELDNSTKEVPEEAKKGKKKRKGKRKHGDETEQPDQEVIEAREDTIISPNDSYHTISTISEPGTVKIVEEAVTPESQFPQAIPTEIITTVPVIEAVVTQETITQTLPLVSEESAPVLEHQSNVETELAATQTSLEPTIETVEAFTEPNRIDKVDIEISAQPDVDETSTQIVTELVEEDTQTSPKPEMDKVETFDSSNQTATPERIDSVDETVQTISPVIPRNESAMQTIEMESKEDAVQTTPPELILASEVATQAMPSISEFSSQTSFEPLPQVTNTTEVQTSPIEEIPKEPTLTFEQVIQTSPVVITDIGDLPLTPVATPTKSTSEEYEVQVQAVFTVPGDSSEVTLSESSETTLQPREEEKSGSEYSSGEFDIEVDIAGVESYIETEKGESKRKIKRRRKKTKEETPHQTSEQKEGDLFSIFHRQASGVDVPQHQLMFSDITKSGLTFSELTKQPEEKEDQSEESVPVRGQLQLHQTTTEDENHNIGAAAEVTKIVPYEPTQKHDISQPQEIVSVESDKMAEVCSKVITDINKDKIKQIVTIKSPPNEPSDEPKAADDQEYEVSVDVQVSKNIPKGFDITTHDTFIVTEDEGAKPQTAFTVESIVTETKLMDDPLEDESSFELTPKEFIVKENVAKDEIIINDKPVKIQDLSQSTTKAATVHFITSEAGSSEASLTPIIMKTESLVESHAVPTLAIAAETSQDLIEAESIETSTPTQIEISEDSKPHIHVMEDVKQKQILKGKSKSKHPPTVTIEEVQTSAMVSDTPLTPVSDSAVSPPEYAVSTWKPAHSPLEEPGNATFNEINIRWNQAQSLERIKNLQNAKKTTHLKSVLYMATLNEIIVDQSVEQRNNDVEQKLEVLRQAVQKADVNQIQQTVITTVETITTWLETIEYRIYLSRQQTSDGPSKERVEEFNHLKQEIANIEEKVDELQCVILQADPLYSEEDRQRMHSYIESLQQQVRIIEAVTEENELLASGDLKRWEEFVYDVDGVSLNIQKLRRQLSDLKESDHAPQTKLNELDEMEGENRANLVKSIHLIATAKSLLRDFPGRQVPTEVYCNHDQVKQLEQQINIEREKSLQFLSLADDYEQTLKEFSQIIEIAEALVESPVQVRNLEHLEDEMQNHRKFFVNLSHCRAILESLEENLDSETRASHSQLHQDLYERARLILDKSTGRFQLMSLAASRWTILEQGSREEMRWLQVAQQRIPDLNSVTSSDYDRYIDLHHSLATDIALHHAKLNHLNEVAQNLQELVVCSGLEGAYSESLEIITRLHEDVQNNLTRLLAFGESWTTYNALNDKVEAWLREAQIQLKKIEIPTGPRGHIRQFWELKAKHEVNNTARQNSSKHLEKSLQIVPISDEMIQRKFHSELQTEWGKVSERINEIQSSIMGTISATDVSVNEKLALLEQELQELKQDVDTLGGVIKTEEELSLYIERLQIMSNRLETIQNELGKLGLLSAKESDRVGTLLALSKRLESTVAEELEGGVLIRERLLGIQTGLGRVRRKHIELSKNLDQCESAEKMGSDAIEKAISECYEVGEELVTLWQDLMSCRQLLHTLPMRLRATVSPLKVEKEISQLQNDHTNLEKRCGQILALLRGRLTLWQRFERQLELVQQSVQEADFMIDLLTVQGTVDYERLRKATERLEGLSGDLVSRENLVTELHDAAQPLSESCAPEVSARVGAAVNEAVTAYNTTCTNLKELCTKYQNATDLWKRYKEASDLVKEWIENPMEFVDELPPEEAAEKVRVCEEALSSHSKTLAELQDLVTSIASAVGLDAKALLGGEVEAMGKRLEDVRSSLSTLADVAEAKSKAREESSKEILGARRYLDSVQKSVDEIQSGDLESETEVKLQALRDHLIALGKAESQIQKIREETVETSTVKTETSVIEILELWQQVFRETFQQYHRLSSRLVKNEDGAAALRLWQEYLLNVQQFLQGTIPGDYQSLSEHQHLCQVHQNLLTTQQNVLKPNDGSALAGGLVETSVMEQFNSLTNLHNETLSRIVDRHREVQKRLEAWEKYRMDQNVLLEWLKNLEKEREQMQLRYLHVRRIPKLTSRIQSLLDKIPQGGQQAESLQQQQNFLLQFCDDALATSIRMEHVAIKQRISNLQAGLETWKQFLERISKLVITHEDRVQATQKLFDGIQAVINESQSQMPTSHAGVAQRLEVLQRTRERLTIAVKELEQLGLSQEQLKECLSPSDIKTVNQRMWLLWHQHGDLDHQLATICHQLEDKLGIKSMFESRHARFITWTDELEQRLDQDSQQSLAMDPRELLRKLEVELQAEMALKEREYEWLIRVGTELVSCCGEEYADVTIKQILQAKTDEVQDRWERLEAIGKSKATKIHDMIQTTMQLEERIRKIRAWLTQIENQMSKPLSFDNCSKEVIERKLQEHEKLKKSVENESGDIGEVLNLCELLLSDEDMVKAHFSSENLANAVQNLERRWKAVCGQSVDRKKKLTFSWKLLQEVLKLSSEQEQWLTNKEQRLKDFDKPASKLDRAQTQEAIYEIESEVKDIESRLPAFQILEQTYSKLARISGIDPENIQELTSKARVVIARWQNLLPKATSILKGLQNELAPFKEFSLTHEDNVVTLSRIDGALTEVQHLDSATISPQDRLKKLEALESELATQTPILESADNLGLQIMKKSKQEEIVKIQEMIDEYQILCKEITQRIQTIKSDILSEVRRQGLREVDESVQVETLKFEQDTAVQVNTLPEQLQRMTSISAKDAYAVELEAAIGECRTNLSELETFVNKAIPKQGSPELPTSSKRIAKMSAKCQASTELIKHLHDLLVNECNATNAEANSDEVQSLIDGFEVLLIKAKEKEQKLRELRTTVPDAYNLLCQHEAGRLLCPLCTKRNWAQLDNDLWRLEKWLQVAEGTQKSRRIPPSNIEQLEDIIQDHHEFLLDLDSHKSIVRSLNIVGTHLADHTEDTTRAEELRARLEMDNKRWESICTIAAAWQVQLQKALMDNQQFHSILSELCAWLEKNERKIKSSEPVDLTAPKETIEHKFHNFLELRAELERCEPRVLSLQEAANQLLRAEDAPEGSSTVHRRLTELRLKLQSLIRLTVVYTLKLGAVLGRDPNEIGMAIAASHSSPLQALSYDLLDQPDGDQPLTTALDETAYNGTTDDSEINTSVLRRGYRFLGRVVRASVPIQALMLLMLGAASLVPHPEDDYACSLVNSLTNSLTPTLRYNEGNPPI